jgi:hypothetical protein
MKKLSFLLLFAAALSLRADVLIFRSGRIVAAEISSTAPAGGDINDKYAFPDLPEQRLYAVVSVKLDAGRKISIFDYALESSGKTYPCVAINSDGTTFRHTQNSIPATDKIMQLLFIIDKRPLQKTELLKLKCNLPPYGIYDLQVPFDNAGYQRLLLPAEIPAVGTFRKSSK